MEQENQTLIDWIFSEAGAGWIFGIVSLLVALLSGLFAWSKRERPPKIVIQEVARRKVLDIHPSQRDKVTVQYRDYQTVTPIIQLQQREFVIYNSGTKDILEPVTLTLLFPREDKTEQRHGIHDLIIEAPRYSKEQVKDDEAAGYEIEFPYINAYSAHKQYINAYLITDGDVEIVIEDGVGKGWSSHFMPLVEESSERRSLTLLLWSVVEQILAVSLILAIGILVSSFMTSSDPIYFSASTTIMLAIVIIVLAALIFKRGRWPIISRRLQGIVPTSEFRDKD